MGVVELRRGSAGTFQLIVKDQAGAPVNLADVEVRFYLKQKERLHEVDAVSSLLTKATSNVDGGADSQILVTDAASGIAEVYFYSEDTKDMPVLTYAYRYRIHVRPANGKNYIVASDKFRLLD